MSYADSLLRARFAAVANQLDDSDWSDVCQRATATEPRRRPRRFVRSRRTLVLALAAAALVIAVGVALAAALGGFSSWLNGEPGTPASKAEQQAFARANANSFLGFPTDTNLRQLITNRVGNGARVDLLGFRAASTLCLRVIVSGKTPSGTQSCAPLAELRRAGPPVRVVLADHGFGRGTKSVWYGVDLVRSSALQVTAGIVADGVRTVVVEDESGRHTLPVKANAFLYVARNPDVGQRVRRIWARQGSRLVPISFAPALFGFGGPAGRQQPAKAPTRVERHVNGGTISWLVRHEPRGQSLDVLPVRTRTFVKRHVVFGRVIAPDSGRPLRIAVTLSTSRHGGKAIGICTWLVTRQGAGGGCSRRADLFTRGPLTLSTGLENGSDQFATASGLASDDVARIAAYLNNGQTLPVPLADNTYIIDLPRSELPAKLVAYDNQGRVVGLSEPIAGFGGGGSAAPGKARPLLHVVSPTGATAELLIGPATNGGHCMYVRWYVSRFVQGVMVNCSDLTSAKAPLALGTSGPEFLMGRVHPSVASIELRYADGAKETIKPIQAFVLYAIPRRHLAKGHELVSAVAENAKGQRIGSGESFVPPPRPRRAKP